MGEAKRRRIHSPPQSAVDWIDVEFIDSGREPTQPPDPDYPHGIKLDVTGGAKVQSCLVGIPYPAPRCGIMTMVCRRCGLSTGCTVAGRPDDPSEIRLPCKLQIGATGQLAPEGKLDPTDEGGLGVAVSATADGGEVRFDFGKPVAWLTLPRDRVMDLCLVLLQKIGVDIQLEAGVPAADLKSKPH
jgi:hypothetical protein